MKVHKLLWLSIASYYRGQGLFNACMKVYISIHHEESNKSFSNLRISKIRHLDKKWVKSGAKHVTEAHAIHFFPEADAIHFFTASGSTTRANIPYGGYARRYFCLESYGGYARRHFFLESVLFLEPSLNDSHFSLNVGFSTDNEKSYDCRSANCIAIAFGPSEAIGCTSQPL